MDLSKFIEDTLIGIHEGVKSANLRSKNDIFEMNSSDNIRFDVAVTVVSTSEEQGGGKISVFSVASLGASAGKEERNESISRIKFEVKTIYNGFGGTIDEDRK